MRLVILVLVGGAGCAQPMPSLPSTSSANTCGDGVVQRGEACDDGNRVETDSCLSNCVLNACGDEAVHVGVEECDDGNVIDQDACRNDCSWSVCGDGTMRLDVAPNEPGYEACDDGNTTNEDACTNQCTLATCGDGFVQAGEACDDGNRAIGDGCTDRCELECGNGILDPNETCDDGNDDDNDSCPSTCRAARCGDGFTRSDLPIEHRDGEACDDGNANNSDGCLNDCTPSRCGDGFARADRMVDQEGYEDCDDGNTIDTDDCPTTCRAARCGDGFIHAGEEVCDDGNDDETDGCRGCDVPRCGDGVVDVVDGEACDGGEDCDANLCQPLVTELVFGWSFGCAGRADGTVLCWPPGDPGENQPLVASGVPVGSTKQVNTVPAVGLTNLQAGYHSVCGIGSTGRVFCWGDQGTGVSGGTPNMGMYDPVARPVRFEGAPEGEDEPPIPIDSLYSAMEADRFCFLDADHQIWCWGNFSQVFWQNMRPNYADGSAPRRLLPGTRDVTSLAIGDEAVCYIASNRVFCVGSNAYNMLGNGELESEFSADPLEISGLRTTVQIVASHAMFCARSDEGTVSCWGNNEYRQVGPIDDFARGTPYQHPNIDRARAVALTYPASCVLRQGELRCWGVPSFDWYAGGSPVNLPQVLGGLPDGVRVVSAHPGGAQICARTSNQRAYCWGNPNAIFGDGADNYTSAVELKPWATHPDDEEAP